MLPTDLMPSFSITRIEAALGASAPRPSRQHVAEFGLVHASEADEAAEAQEILTPANPDAEEADVLLGEHAPAPGDEVPDRRAGDRLVVPEVAAHVGLVRDPAQVLRVRLRERSQRQALGN